MRKIKLNFISITLIFVAFFLFYNGILFSEDQDDSEKKATCFIKTISQESFSDKSYSAVCFGRLQFYNKKKSLKDNSVAKIRLFKRDTPKHIDTIEVANGDSFIAEATPGEFEIKDIFFRNKYYQIGKSFTLGKKTLCDLGTIKVKLMKESTKEYKYDIHIISKFDKNLFSRETKLRVFLNKTFPPKPDGNTDINLYVPNWYNAPKASFTETKTLFKAARNGDKESLLAFLKEGSDINMKDNDGWTPLMYGLYYGQKDIAALLLSKGSDMNALDNEKWTALMYALRYDHTDTAKKMIEMGAQLNIQNKNLWVPLMTALRYNQLDNAKAMIEKGADVNLKNKDGWSPLMFALRYGRSECADLLIAKGADINAKSADDWTPLLYALRNGQTEAAKKLIEMGADINAKNDELYSPLIMALRNKQPGNAKLLIEKGADIMCKSKSDWTTLMFALRYDEKELAALLIAKGVDINAKDNEGWSALMYALQFKQPENAKLLIEKKAAINHKNKNAWTPLLMALRYGQKENAMLLLKKSAEINVKNKDGWTPLMMALRNDNRDAANLMIKKGAKINEKNAKGNSALLFALQFDQAENAGLLIKKGADINIKAQNGWTPLMNALRYDQPENAALMIKKGADVNARNQDSWTPLFFALRYKQPENARRIIEKGAVLNTTISGGWSPLLIALRNDQAENAKLIINKGADINARSDSNWSPLLMALKYDQPENARILIEKGADVTIKNNNGLSAIALAQTKNYSEIIRLLKKSGIKVPTASTPENSYVQPSEYTNQFTASRKPAPPKPVEEQKAILTSMGFPIPPATITFKVGDCAGKQSCFADIEVNSSKKEVFNFLKSQLQKGGWVIDQAICARKENGSLKKKSLWGLINVNKGYITQTVLIPSNKAKKFKKTQVTLSFFSRAPKHSVMVSNFVKSIPKVTGFGNKMNQRFEFGNWAVTVRSAFTTGTSITKKKYFKKKPYVFSINQKGGVHLLRVKVALERLDHKPIKKSFLTDVTVRSTTGSLYKWLAAGTEHGEYFVRNGGTKSMLIPMQPKSDDIEYVFAIPTNATITHFIWEAKNLIAIQAK